VKILSFEVATSVDLFPHTTTAGMARFGDRRESVILKEGETWGLRQGVDYVHPTIAFCMVTGDASPETANAIEEFLRRHCWESHVKVTEDHFSLDYQYYGNQPFRAFLHENSHFLGEA
jgi:hypothetical protein